MEKRPQGRPPLELTGEQADRLCEEISSCVDSLAKIVSRLQQENTGFPSIASIFRKLREDSSFETAYLRAKAAQADFMADQLLEIADNREDDESGNVAVQRAKLMVNTRQWLAGKLRPGRYGNKLEIENKESKQITFTIVRQGDLPALSRVFELPTENFPKKISNE